LFKEAALIGQCRDALANRQTSVVVLSADGFGTPHLAGKSASAFDLVDFGLPAHAFE
jgi:hypothetical protein